MTFFKKNTDSLIAAAAGFLIIFLFTRHGGIGIEPDGVVYLTTAENLHSNFILTDFTHNPVIEFPAFYPLFLCMISWMTGLKALLFAPVLNALLFAILIFLSGYIIDQFSCTSKWYKRILLSCIVLSPCLLEVYSMLWSETLFIICLLVFMMAMHRYFQSYSRGALIAAAVIASVASVTRYAGIGIIATGGILLLLDLKLPLRQKWRDVILYSSISPLLLIINLARNYSVSGTMTGVRERAIRSLNENTRDVGSVFYNWVSFLHVQSDGKALLAIFLMGVISFTCIKQVLKNSRLATFENIAACFFILYVLFMIASASISRFEQLNSRFLSPLFIPLLFCIGNWIVYPFQKANHFKRKWLLVLGVIIFLIFQYNQLTADYETWDGVKDAGIPGYTEDQWTHSETVQFIQKDALPFKKDHTIYSNAYDAVYFFTERPGKFLPHKESSPELEQFLNDHHCYLVWFTDGDNPDLVDITFIKNVKNMKLLKQFSDGAIYEYDEK